MFNDVFVLKIDITEIELIETNESIFEQTFVEQSDSNFTRLSISFVNVERLNEKMLTPSYLLNIADFILG